MAGHLAYKQAGAVQRLELAVPVLFVQLEILSFFLSLAQV